MAGKSFVGDLGSETGRFLVVDELVAADAAVQSETDHYLHFAAKAPVGIGFDCQSDDFAVTANRIHCQAFVIRGGNVGSFRKRIVVKSFGDDFGNGAEFKVIFDRFNRRLGFAVDIGQYQGRQRADDDQSRGHIEKV